MRLIPYKNLFEFDIPNRVEYENYKHSQLREFRDYLVSRPDTTQYIPDIYGKVSVQKGAIFPFFVDVISQFYNSIFTGLTRYSTPRYIEPNNAIPSDLNKDILEKWTKFHHTTSNMNIVERQKETEGWKYSNDGRILSTLNTNGYIGLVSEHPYSEYYLDVKMSSTVADNDRMAVVICYYFDEATGKEHTLSAIRNNDSKGFTWRLVYNYLQKDSFIVEDKSYIIPTTTENWNKYPDGTRIKIERLPTGIKCYTTLNNSSDFLEDSLIEVNFDDRKRQVLSVFSRPCKYGFGCHSQAGTSFSDIKFIDYSKSYPNFLGKTTSILLRGDNYTGRHLIPKLITQLDPNMLLLSDDNSEDITKIIASVSPMFRTILLGFYVTGIVNGGTDMIETVKSHIGLKDVMDKIYSREEFREYNIIIEGDIPQNYINHFYLHHIKLNQKYNLTRDWLDVFVLPQKFIDRMHNPVSEQHFKMWGYCKRPHTLKHLSEELEEMLLYNSLRSDEVLNPEEEPPLPKYPSTVSLPREKTFDMLCNLLTGANVRKFTHYKTKPPVSCYKLVNPGHGEVYEDNIIIKPEPLPEVPFIAEKGEIYDDHLIISDESLPYIEPGVQVSTPLTSKGDKQSYAVIVKNEYSMAIPNYINRLIDIDDALTELTIFVEKYSLSSSTISEMDEYTIVLSNDMLYSTEIVEDNGVDRFSAQIYII